VGEPVVVDPERREQAIAAALAEFDATQAAPSADTAPVTPLPQRRPTGVRWLGAAAAVVVVLGAVALLQRDDTAPSDTATAAATTAAGEAGGAERLSGTDDGSEDAALSAESAPTTQAARGGAAAAPDEAANDAASGAPAPNMSIRDLGEVESAPALQSQLDTFSTGDDADRAAPSTICEPEVRAASPVALGRLVDSATLRWQGAPARALVFATSPSATLIVVTADPTCEVLAQIG
jgi:hypothetical protein